MKNLSEILEQAGVFQYGIVDTAKVEFSHEVRKMCEANICRQYGATWACPPAIGTIEECEARCRKYGKMLVFSVKYALEDSFDYEGMTKGMTDFKSVARKLEGQMQLQLDDYIMLANEGCDLCEKCAYPDKPCRLGNKVHGSIEGYGIFVSELAAMAGMNYMNGQNTVTYFGALLFNE